MEIAKYRLEIYNVAHDYRGEMLVKKLNSLGYNVNNILTTDNYLLNFEMTQDEISSVTKSLLQNVTQNFSLNKPYLPNDFSYAVEVGFLPGVTDNVSHTVREAIEDLLKRQLDMEKSVFTSVSYFFTGNISEEQIKEISMELYNPLIQRVKIVNYSLYKENNGMGKEIPVVHIKEEMDVDEINLNLSEKELLSLGKEGIKNSDGTRRGPLALDLVSMGVIKDYFLEREKRNPSDIEIEAIAQTWSEHCKHTIFAADMDDDILGGIYKRYIKEATIRIRREKGEKDFCVSVFTDNAGGIEFDENYIVADKVETHNSPSALDPFGGSITGIVGVNRDAMGFGMASKPVANRYGYCFADPSDTAPLYRSKDKDSKLLSPRRIMEGVIQGVNVGGNTSGIPTPQGFVYFDERYKGKPLVFVGTVGLIPRIVKGKSSVQKKAMPGDNIVMVGGRVGRDGIHGATFSSEALNSGSPATAVQIGDPITQKKMSDAIVKEARDLGLYNSITDNGAGGLSCSVAEMAKESGGFVADLDKVPLKYPGLSPWQIWVSESQERMTLSIPDDKLDEFFELMKKRGVEATVIGKFNDGNRGIVYFNGEKIFDLDMTFLHDGLPKKKLTTSPVKRDFSFKEFDEPDELNPIFLDMLNRLNIASFEFISSQYDHEVQGNSILKPLQGKGRVNGNASVIRPILDSKKGVVLSQGLYPSYSEISPYDMAACSIDTAIRNAISCGGSLDYMALLDNFCWCDSTNEERLAELKEAARACYEIAVDYGTPFVSGKDSMFNDFKGYDENFNECQISISPTLLISSIGVIDDVSAVQSIDFKFAGDLVYLIGETEDRMGGSEYLAYMGEKITDKKFFGNDVPKVDTKKFSKTYRTFEKAMKEEIIASSISVERGGLAIAIAKSAIAGDFGVKIAFSNTVLNKISRMDYFLFSETQGRILVSINPANKEKFEMIFKDVDFFEIGTVSNDKIVRVETKVKEIVSIKLDEVAKSYKSKFEGF